MVVLVIETESRRGRKRGEIFDGNIISTPPNQVINTHRGFNPLFYLLSLYKFRVLQVEEDLVTLSLSLSLFFWEGAQVDGMGRLKISGSPKLLAG